MGFAFADTSVQAVTGRTIPGSQELISTCNALALDAIKKAGSDPEIGTLAAAVQSGDHEAELLRMSSVDCWSPDVQTAQRPRRQD